MWRRLWGPPALRPALHPLAFAWPRSQRTVAGLYQAPSLESFVAVETSPALIGQLRGKRSATLKKSHKEKRARRPSGGAEDPPGGARRVFVVSCNEVPWELLMATFPTAERADGNVLYMAESETSSEALFLFPYGVCVFWGVRRDQIAAQVQLMNEIGVPYPRLRKVDFSPVRDDDFFYYTHRSLTPPPEPEVQAPPASASAHPPLCTREGSNFTLSDSDPRLKLALSHAFAQSTRLDVLEQQFRLISIVTKGIAPRQRDTGQIPVDWEEVDLLSTIGALDAIRRELEIDGSIHSPHNLFWDEDELSDVVDATREYLQIEERVSHLLDQIALVRSQLGALQAEIHALRSTSDHRGAIRREWYIIFLIFYEGVIIKLVDVGEIIAHAIGL